MHPVSEKAVEASVAQHRDSDEPRAEAVGPFPLADDREEDLDLRTGHETLPLRSSELRFVGDGCLDREPGPTQRDRIHSHFVSGV
jgi:hypothetical protein